MKEEIKCPQCQTKLSELYASRLVVDACGHKKCRTCLLNDENKCKSCEQSSEVKQPKQNTNVIRFHYPKENVPKSSPENKPKGVTKPSKLLKCEVCKQEFRRKSHLEWHMRRHTGERPFACHLCPKTFTQKSKINRHLLSHSDERKFKCKDCDKGFNSQSVLTSHLRIHSGEKPHECNICHTKFTELSNLSKHLTIHTNEKPYMCDICGTRFSLKWRLTVHLRVHNRQNRPHSCTQCPKTFSNRKDLNRHLVIHSGVKPYKCITCTTYFRRKDNLERHIKNTHPDKKDQEIVVVEEKKVEVNNKVSVINGPIKMENVDIYKRILSPMMTTTERTATVVGDGDTAEKILSSGGRDIIKMAPPPTIPRLHSSFETSDAIIKNIKFKLPKDYLQNVANNKNIREGET